ncbi:MAG: PAC2 family protein [Nitrospirota bacterium]
MGVRFFKEPDLKKPILICGWPGIGNIGFIAAETLRRSVNAEEFAEIESWDFFYPQKVMIKKGLMEDLQFPANKFYFKKLQAKDLLFFIAEEQPRGDRKAYQIGEYVLDVAMKFGCQRIFTSGAAVALIHHQMKPRVWAVPNKESLIDEVRRYENTILLSDIEERTGQGYISGLNGLLIGIAKERDLEAICLMGEFPLYVSHSTAYPKASKSVLEVLAKILRVEIDLSHLERWSQKTEEEIEKIYEQVPNEMKEQIEKFKSKPTELGPLGEAEKEKLFREVQEFLKRSKEDGEISM